MGKPIEMKDVIPRVQAVTFDLWETLLFEREGYDARRSGIRCTNLSNALIELGISIPVERLGHALKAMGPWLAEFWDRNNEVTHIDQIRFIIEVATGSSVGVEEAWIDQLSSAYAQAIFDIPPYLNPDVLPLLQWLKNQGKKIGLISNVGRTPGFALRKFLEAESAAEYFDSMIFSDEVGVRKPDPKIFTLAVQKLGLVPGSVVHVGDDMMSDVLGAKNAGLMALHFSSSKGRDALAESDPTSLISIARKKLDGQGETVPDGTITSLSEVAKALQQLDR